MRFTAKQSLSIHLILIINYDIICPERYFTMTKIYSAFFAVLATATVIVSPVSAGKNEEQKHQDRLLKLQKKLEKQRDQRRRKVEELRIKARIVNERFEFNQPKWKGQFELSCPLGGYDDVIITYALADQFTYWRGGGAMKTFMARPRLVRIAKNPYTNITLNITSGGRKIVENLCPGGSITLVDTLSPVVGGMQKRIVWTAEGVIDGRLAYGYFIGEDLSLWDTQWEPQKNRPPWVMNLDRVDKEF